MLCVQAVPAEGQSEQSQGIRPHSVPSPEDQTFPDFDGKPALITIRRGDKCLQMFKVADKNSPYFDLPEHFVMAYGTRWGTEGESACFSLSYWSSSFFFCFLIGRRRAV